MRWRSTPGRKLLDPRMIALAVLFIALLFAARSCQQSQVRFTQAQAEAIARQAGRASCPTETQVRLVRQGLGSRPYWAVSLSVPAKRVGQDGDYHQLTIVRVDANTGKVVAITPIGRLVTSAAAGAPGRTRR